MDERLVSHQLGLLDSPAVPPQGHFPLAEHQTEVGQESLIGTLTASRVLQERYQSA